jgi:hypothetical protein
LELSALTSEILMTANELDCGRLQSVRRGTMSVLTSPARVPPSISAFLTHWFNVCAVQPILPAIPSHTQIEVPAMSAGRIFESGQGTNFLVRSRAWVPAAADRTAGR